MDPLRKIDSAISVASKDNGVYEGQPVDDFPPDDYPPPTSSSHAHAHARSRSDDDKPPSSGSGLDKDHPIAISMTADSRQEATKPATVSQAQAQPQPQSKPALAPAPAPAPAGTAAAVAAPALAPAPAQAPAPASALENLDAPLDRAQPASTSPYSQPPLRSPSTPSPPTTQAVDPSASTSVRAASAAYAVDNNDDDADPQSSPSGGSSHQRGYPAAAATIPATAEDDDLHYHQGYPSELDALTQSGTGAIDVDHDQLELESDAGYESEDRGSLASTSLSSSVRDYLFENGRRYHRFREGRYNFPNDEPEQDREDMKHACVKMLCQEQLYFAPIDDELNPPQNILDIGTGTGIWAIEMGDQFPSANVLGIDLSPIQPEWVPANVHFLVDDAESEWVHPPDYFDYIHTRHTVMAIKDWPKLYRTALEHIRPGGWMESQEIYHYPISANDTMPHNHPVAQYWYLINEGLQRLGIDFHAAAGGKIANMMRDAGFVNVHERVFHVPLGTWPRHPDLKRVGEYWRHVLLEGLQAIALGPLTRGCGWTREQVEVFLVEVRRAYFDNSCLMYMPMYVTYGQKLV